MRMSVLVEMPDGTSLQMIFIYSDILFPDKLAMFFYWFRYPHPGIPLREPQYSTHPPPGEGSCLKLVSFFVCHGYP